MAKSTQQPELVFSVDKSSNELSCYHYGKQACPPSNSYGPAKRNYYLIHFVTEGKGTYTVGDKTFHLHKNEAFLIRPNEETILLPNSFRYGRKRHLYGRGQDLSFA